MTHKVLLVDDESHVLDGLKRTLRKESYQILTAGSGDQALDVMAETEIDVVVSDEKMPGLSGTELLAAIQKQYPRTVRIMLTGQADLGTAMRAINEGQIYRFFTKPCNEIDLALSIREAIQQRHLIGQSRRLIEVMQMQSNYIQHLEQEAPGISKVERDPSGAIVLAEEPYSLDDILKEVNEELDQAEKRLGSKKKD